MITEKQKCIAEQAVYGDFKTHFIVNDLSAGKHISIEGQSIPILRPLSDLTKEITHKGYNEDKPFIPLVELAKTALGTTITDQFKLVNDTVVDFTIAYHFKQNVMWFQSLQRDKKAYILPNQNKFFDLLHLWHFDTRNLIESDEAADANTLDINPYSV